MLILRRAERSAIAVEARRCYPDECCGFLLGARADGHAEVVALRPAPNAHADAPRGRFAISPELVLRAQREAEARGLEIVGFYHSHPDGEADPSRLDREHAWPGHSYVIVAVRDGAPGETRSWVLGPEGDRFVEEALAVGARP